MSIVEKFGPMPNIFIFYDWYDVMEKLDNDTFLWYVDQLDYSGCVPRGVHECHTYVRKRQEEARLYIAEWYKYIDEFNEYFERNGMSLISEEIRKRNSDPILCQRAVLGVYDNHFFAPLRRPDRHFTYLYKAAEHGLHVFIADELSSYGYDKFFILKKQIIDGIMEVCSIEGLYGKKSHIIKKRFREELTSIFPNDRSFQEHFVKTISLVSSKDSLERIRTGLISRIISTPSVNVLLKIIKNASCDAVVDKVLYLIDPSYVELCGNVNLNWAIIVLTKCYVKSRNEITRRLFRNNFIDFIRKHGNENPRYYDQMITAVTIRDYEIIQTIELFLGNRFKHYIFKICSNLTYYNKFDELNTMLDRYPLDSLSVEKLVQIAIRREHLDLFGLIMSKYNVRKRSLDELRLYGAIKNLDVEEIIKYKKLFRIKLHNNALIRADNIDIFKIFYPGGINPNKFENLELKSNLLEFLLRNHPEHKFDSENLTNLFQRKRNREILLRQYKWSNNEYILVYSYLCENFDESDVLEFLEELRTTVIFTQKNIPLMKKIIHRTIRYCTFRCFMKNLEITPDGVCYNLNELGDILERNLDIIFYVKTAINPKILYC